MHEMKKTVPLHGTYTTEAGKFNVDILEADGASGDIEAKYTAEFSPEGRLSEKGTIGKYFWVESESQGQGGAPFTIRFSAQSRPDGRPYSIIDSWTGAYRIDDTLLMNGVRSYVNGKGKVQVIDLGTLVFTPLGKICSTNESNAALD